MLAGFNLLHGRRKLGGQGHGNYDQSFPAHGLSSEDVFGFAVAEVYGLAGQSGAQRKPGLQQGPRRRSRKAGFQLTIHQGQRETALQGFFMTAEFAHHAGKIAAGKGMLGFRRGRNGRRLGSRVLRSVIGEQTGHRLGVFPDFFHRAGEPFVDGTVHQPIGKKKQEDDRQERKQQGAHQHAAAEF